MDAGKAVVLKKKGVDRILSTPFLVENPSFFCVFYIIFLFM